MTFDELVERKDAERAERDRTRVSWRRVAFDPEHPLASEWSGMGSERRLVYVRRDTSVDQDFHYGRRIGVKRVEMGKRGILGAAKMAAEELLVGAS